MNEITAVTPDQSLTITQEMINSDRTDVWGGNVKLVDLDNDGDLDVTIASVDTDVPPCDTSVSGGIGGIRTFVLFENQGSFSGNIVDPYAGITNNWDVSNYDQEFIDIDNDGNMDLILGGCEGYHIFMNNAEPILAIEDTTASNSFNVSPNPSGGVFTIQAGNLTSAEAQIEVYTVTGKLIFSEEVATEGQQLSANLDLSDSASGMYFVKLTTEVGITTKRIIIE